MPPEHPRQMRVLFPERTVQILSTPFCHGSQRSGITVFGRYLPDHVLAVPRHPPHVGKAEEVERGSRRCGVTPAGASEPEVYEAGLGRVEPKPKATKALTQHVQQSLAGQVVLEGNHSMPSMPGAPSLRVRRYASNIHSRSIRWCSEDSTCSGCFLASSAIHCRFVDRFVGLRVPSRVSRQWISARGDSLPSSGSWRARFPAFAGTMKPLRHPTLLARPLMSSPPGSVWAWPFVLASALPRPPSRRSGLERLSAGAPIPAGSTRAQTGSLRFPGVPSRTSALLSDPGRTGEPGHRGFPGAAPAPNTAKASAFS
jgi:hypothetical protein